MILCGPKTADQWAKVAVRIGKVKAEWHWGEREWKEEVQQVIIEKTKTPLSQAWQHPLHQVPPTPPFIPPRARHPIPTRRGNFPLSTTQPSSIYPSIHLSFPPTNGNNNTQQHNNTTDRCSSSLHLHLQTQVFTMTGLLIRPLKSVPAGERDTSESCKECNWQVLVWSSHPVCQRIPYSPGL